MESFYDFFSLISSDSSRILDLLFRLMINTVFTVIIARWFYFPKSRRTDFLFTYILVGFGIFMLIHLMGDAKLKTGIAMGLFAIFCIMRYRTESVPIREMTYLFLIIAMAAINGLAWVADISDKHPEFFAPELTAIIELTVTNVLFVAVIWIAEDGKWAHSRSSKYIKYDKIELIVPEKREELIEDLKKRTGLNIQDVTIGPLDFLKDVALIKVFYEEDKQEESDDTIKPIKAMNSVFKRTFVLAVAAVLAQVTYAQSDDFGYELGLEGETKIANNLKLEVAAEMRTQDDAQRIDRYMVGAGLSYKLFSNKAKTFSVKVNGGFDYLWTNKLAEKNIKYFDANDDLVEGEYFNVGDEKGYNVTDGYWQDRYRINVGAQVSYDINKRWSVSLKETLRYNHYCKATTTRTKYRYDENISELDEDGNPIWIMSPYKYSDDYVGEDNLDENGNVIGKSLNQETVTKRKDRTFLYSKLTVNYDIRKCPLDLFVSADYGRGLTKHASKWKLTGGVDYKINKYNKLTLSYRYSTDGDDDEGNGHLVGLGYKFDF